jgi:hypothetical protein
MPFHTIQVAASLFVGFLFFWETFVPSLVLWRSKLLYGYILMWFSRLLSRFGNRVGGHSFGRSNQSNLVIQPRITSQSMQQIPVKLIKYNLMLVGVHGDVGKFKIKVLRKPKLKN